MKETRVKCDSCGRIVPRSKTVPIYRKKFGTITKVYLCIGCAKHRGIKFHEARERAKRGFTPRRRNRRE